VASTLVGPAGWTVVGHMRTELVTDPLTVAIERRRPAKGQTAVHSDRGSQYLAVHQLRIPEPRRGERGSSHRSGTRGSAS